MNSCRVFLLTLICLSPLVALTGCSSATIAAKESIFGIAKRDQLVARVQDAKQGQVEAKKQFESALAQFLDVTGQKGKLGDIEAKYDKLKSAYEAADGKASKVSSRIKDVENVADALFSEWQKELGQYTNQSLRSASESQLNATKAQYQTLLSKMRAAEGKMQPVLQSLKEHVLFLKHNLNAQAIASLQGEATSIQNDVSSLIREMEASITEATTFIDKMQTSK
jgi:Skp family chaperone for outer membrane proteins